LIFKAGEAIFFISHATCFPFFLNNLLIKTNAIAMATKEPQMVMIHIRLCVFIVYKNNIALEIVRMGTSINF
jgi:hypothetical protein